MTEFRYILTAEKLADGAITSLAKFKSRDLGDVILEHMSDKFPGYSLQIEDIYKERTTADILADDDEFD